MVREKRNSEYYRTLYSSSDAFSGSITGLHRRNKKSKIIDISFIGIMLIFIVYVLLYSGCSGVPKSTVNMTNCTIIESPSGEGMIMKCYVDSKDNQTAKQDETETEPKPTEAGQNEK